MPTGTELGNKVAVQEDSEKAYTEEKLRMRSAKAMSEHQQTRAFFSRICRVGVAGFTRWKFVEGCY